MGRYDFFLATKEKAAQELFDCAVETLRKNLDRYDLGFWSLYELSGTRLPMVASPFYHQLHVTQLRLMHRLTGDDVFSQIRRSLGGICPQPDQADSRPVLQGRFQALLLLGTREDPLRLTIFSAGDGGARRPGGMNCHAIGRKSGHEVTVLTGFPNHPTGVVPAEYRRKFRRLVARRRTSGVNVVRTWLLPFPNRRTYERMLNYSSFCLSAAVTGTVHGAP